MNQQASNQQRNQQHQPKHKPQHEPSDNQQSHPPAATVPTQSQIYDNLRRIGELEDKKLSIQNEIESRTVKLRGALKHVASDSLLYKMLASVLGKADSAAAASTKTGSRKKKAATKKKKSPKRAGKKSTKKKTTKKRAGKRKRR
jgi:hypothetical protein